jgi:hypothetical protein
LLLYRGDKPVGVARLVNYTDNSKRKRIGGTKRDGGDRTAHKDTTQASSVKQKENTISYSDVIGGVE